MGLFDPPIKLDASGRMVPPTRLEIEAVFLDLIDGRRSRDEVVQWAGQWVFGYPSDDMNPAVWDALVALVMVDSITTDRPYLFMKEDFRSWLEDFRKRVR